PRRLRHGARPRCHGPRRDLRAGRSRRRGARRRAADRHAARRRARPRADRRRVLRRGNGGRVGRRSARGLHDRSAHHREGAVKAALAVVAFWLGFWLALLAPRTARADVARYALVVGHDAGHSDEQRLRYAEDDARRLAEVLVDLGGFAADNVTVLRAPSPDAVQGALIGINDRIRTRGEPAVLVVFYSGHADALALHLGAGELPLERLEQLVRGSAAAFRLLIVDACRSGALTHVKGGTPTPAQPVQLAERLPADGLVVWTSSSATEDAQESDDIKGSFFTHYLVSGLLGAADSNGDGAVTLGEAYAHAYEATVRATSRTLAGVQHATYRHDIRGLADLTLTWLTAASRGLLAFPAGHDYLVMQGGADG